ncbi:MAG: hypothetical protein WB952_03385 [Terriglobales bacterium]
MKRIIKVWLATGILAGVMVPVSSAQISGGQDANALTSNPQEPSLGTYARAARKDKKQEAAKRFDNDNLPRTDKLSVVGSESQVADSPASPDATQPRADAGGAAETPKMTPGMSEEGRQKVIDQWQQKLSDQHAQIDALSRDLELNQREYRVHAAEYYDGDRMRNQATWGKDDAEYKQKIADEQKAIEEAKQKFGDLEEEARHSGVPSSVSEAVEQQPETAPQQPENRQQQSETSTQQGETSPEQQP